MSINPTYLTDCEKLEAEPWHECTHFSRFVLLRPKPRRSGDRPGDDRPAAGKLDPGVATLPTNVMYAENWRLTQLTEEATAIFKGLHSKFPFEIPDPRPAPQDLTGIEPDDFDLGNLRPGRMPDADSETMQGVRRPAPAMGASIPSKMRAEARLKGGSLRAPADQETPFAAVIRSFTESIISAAREFSAVAAKGRSKAIWAVGIDFKQCWDSKGYMRGRLVRSVPLTPGEQLEVVIRTWDKRTERKSQVESVSRQLSTEVTGEEKWMLATKLVFGDQTNASINPNAGVNGGVSIPIEVVSVNLGGDLGIEGNFANQLSQTAENGTEYIHSLMLKAAQSLQSSRTNSVELSHEVGEEITRKQVIANTNRCHTLTFHYFEVTERFEITTKFNGVALYLLIPLPLPEITPEWVLCHECYLRKVLPCETYYAGFEGAKTILEWNELSELYPAATLPPRPPIDGGGNQQRYVSPFADAVDRVLELWNVLKNAELVPIGENPAEELIGGIVKGGEEIGGAIAQFGNDVASGRDVGESFNDAAEGVGNGLKEIGDAAGEGLSDVGEAVGSLLPRMALRSSSRRARPSGGAGSWFYREVAEIVAPQIADSFDFLEQEWPKTQNRDGVERAAAEFNVLVAFRNMLGQEEHSFGKVDATCAIIATAAGVTAVLFNALTFAVAAAIAALLVTLEGLGLADTVPDDGGLRAATRRLFSLISAANPSEIGLATTETAIGSAVDGLAAEQRWREQMQKLAAARVEYERLACHLKDNLSVYMQGLWMQWPDHKILTEVKRHGIPERAIVPRFERFHGNYGALPVVNKEWLLKRGGLDWEKTTAEITALAAKSERIELITLPTSGMTVEPALGHCDACDPFIEEHRKYDLQLKAEEVAQSVAKTRQTEAEATRFEARVNQDPPLLDDPEHETATLRVALETKSTTET